MAQPRVLSTPELLEIILLDLDIRTLLFSAQLTCRTWTNVIKNTPSIQRALFFTPDLKRTDKEINPLLNECFPTFLPNLQNLALGPSHSGFPPRKSWAMTLTRLDMMKSSHKTLAYLRREASWRRMLTQQPPAMNISLVRIVTERDKIPVPCGPTGLRMGTFFHFVIFNEEISFAACRATRVFSKSDALILQQQAEVSRYSLLGYDMSDCDFVLVTSNFRRSMARTPGVTGPIFEPPMPLTEDEKVQGQIKASYETLGLWAGKLVM